MTVISESIGSTNLPNFLIIGAAKAGTTSLYYYLKQHPQIFMSSVKEPRFFALEGEELNFQNPDNAINFTSITNFIDYTSLFESVTNEIAVGEASPLYMYSNKAIDRIHKYIPEVKLIAILRNPVDRAYSSYKHLIALEKSTFAEALLEEENRINNNWAHLWHYKNAGYYYKQLKPYFDRFDKSKIKILLFEDLMSKPLELLREIFSFLEVDTTFIPDMNTQNVSVNPKYKFLDRILNGRNVIRSSTKMIVPERARKFLANGVRGWNSKEFPPIPSEVKLHLIDEYKEDILNLQELLEIDLSSWLA